MITQQIKLNLIPGQVFPRVNASQYDSGTRTLQMALYNGDQVFNIASGMTAVVQGTKPDKTGFQYAATITEGSNIATLDITQQMTAVKGDVICELVISNGNNRIATVNFILYVEAAALAGDTVISETDLPLIEEAVELAQTIGTIAQQVTEDAQTASSAATRAEDAAEAAETWSSNAPYIGANDHWYVYDSTTEQFVDTGVSAEGQTGPQGPQGPTGETGATGPQGPTGATGNGITSITKTSTVGLVDTYTILFTDGTSTTFTVTNGQDGQGSGDMTKAVYDPNNAVADAGGIVAYVQAHSGAGTLAGLDDVALSSLASGQSLVYDATAQKWKNGQISYANISGKPTLGSAAAKNSTDTLSSGSTDLIESGAVHSAIQTLTNQVKDMNNVLGSKNLLPNNAVSQTINGITFTVNDDGSVTANGTTTRVTEFPIINENLILNEGNYILSTKNNIPTNVYFSIYITGQGWKNITNGLNSIEFSKNSNIQISTCRLYIANGVTVSDLTFYPMIRLASIADDTYVPYAKTNQQLTQDTTALLDNLEVNGAVNMLPNTATTQTVNGITFTVNDYGTVTANGTATANAELTLNTSGTSSAIKGLETGNYKLSGCPSGGGNNTYRLFAKGTNNTYYNDDGDGALISNTGIAYVRIFIESGQTVSNLTFKPMITVSSYNGDYVPYAKSNKELTEDNNDLNTKMSYINPINGAMNVYMTSNAIPSWGNFTAQDATDIAQAMYDTYKKLGGEQGNYFGSLALRWYKKSDKTFIGSENDLCEVIMTGSDYDTCLADNSKTRMRFSLKPCGYCVTTDFALWGSNFNYLRRGTDSNGTVVDYHEKQTAGTISTYVG